ncbi:MAG: ABC transporter ATP-binding protein, partial [Spirochaetia bacterium]|nr:ABC transporter ATP-binding protein [Spirochaetia bacterium]
LLRIVSSIDQEYEGVVRLGNGVRVGYFAQDTEKTLNPSNTVLEEVSSVAATDDLPKLRNYLGSFLFIGDDVFKSVSVLSGGERSRLALLKILLHPVNLLILDEPTNHLDINAKKMLLQALEHYDGTMIFVSHDAYFIEHIANKILYLTEEDPPQLFLGDYSYFSYKLDQKQMFEDKEEQQGVEKTLSESALSYKEMNRMKNRLASLKKQSEQMLHSHQAMEEEIKQVELAMSLVENYSDAQKIKSLIDQKNDHELKLIKQEEQWLELTMEIEDMEAQLAGH